MGLSFFADHCVPYSIIRSLRDTGYEVLILKDHIPPDSADSVVIAKAQELKTILISLNGDFADIVSYPPAEYRGIISKIRCQILICEYLNQLINNQD